METVGQGAEAKTKPVLYLEDEKPMVLNASNLEALSDAFGDDTDTWPGHKVKIRGVKTQYQGKAVDGLRVQPVVPRPALKDDLNDEIATGPPRVPGALRVVSFRFKGFNNGIANRRSISSLAAASS